MKMHLNLIHVIKNVSFALGLFFAGIVFLLTFAINPAKEELQKLNLQLNEKKLHAGKIQTFAHKYDTDGKGIRKRVVGVILLDAPVATVWKVLGNWDAMGEYVSSLKYYKTIKILGSTTENQIRESLIEGLLKVAFVKVQYTLRVRFDENNLRQDWNLVTKEEAQAYNTQNININKSSGILRNIEGFGYIEPYGDGNKTIYYYAPIVEVSGPIPDWIERKISKSSLKEYMNAVKIMVSEHIKKK